MRFLTTALALGLLTTLHPHQAAAQESETETEALDSDVPSDDVDDKQDEEHLVSLTFAPILLVLPIVEITGEIRLPYDMSAALIGGGGSIAGVTLWEVGGQFRYYPLGSFDHGMPIGLQAVYVGGADQEDGIRASANGLGVGPFIGYKVAWDFGLTIDTALGAQYIFIDGQATDGDTTVRESQGEFGPILRLNLGWSF